jgi:hypothetical protein
MNLRLRPRHAVAELVLAAACLMAGPASAAAIHGAIFTTDAAGNVNVNIYDAKADVYLNGGPTNDNCAAAGVDDGTYVFQITNPNGDTLLSTDDISHREFTVSGGVIVAPANDHPSVGGDCGGIRVQMAPFNDTPNNGGEYKAWITRKDDYIANGNTFKPGSVKTDNFKVKVAAPEGKGGILVYKFYDANGNGIWDSEEVPLFGWAMTVTGTGYSSIGLTQSPDGLVTFSDLGVGGNPYSVEEGNGGSRWVQSASLVNGSPSGLSPENPVAITLVAGETTQVDFGNYCTCAIKPYPTSYWLGSGGQTKLNDKAAMTPEFKLLNGANLRSPAGGQFNLSLLVDQATNYANLSSWLMGADSSTNEAYRLSAQLAILKLNVEAGYVRKTYYYKGYGTVDQAIADANALLSNAICGTTCNTDPVSPAGVQQEVLRTIIADINDGVTLIQPTPCPYKFALPPPL